MTWARVVATGSGTISFRLMIAGHPYEFVSSPALIGAGSDGRLRIGGLDPRSVQWSESLDPAQCKLTARGFTARIVEDGEHRTGDSFVRAPSKTLYLSSSITDAVVALPLDSTNTSNGDVLYLGQECVLVTAGGGTAAPTVTRSYRNTRAQYHYVDASLGLSRPEVTSSRPTIEGTLAYLYAYGDGETGDGTLVWTGIVAAQPKLRDLTTWEVVLDSVTSILDQSLSADLQDPVTLRGISYTSATGPRLVIRRRAGANESDAPTADEATIDFTWAFYETQDEWCAAVNAAITTATAAWSAGNKLNVAGGALPTLIAAPTDDGSWGLTLTTAATPYWHYVDCAGALDPYFSTFALGLGDPAVSVVAASTPYAVNASHVFDGSGTVPRGSIGGRSVVANRVYLGGATTLTTTDSVLMLWPDFAGQPTRGVTYSVSTWTAALRYAEVTPRMLDVVRLYARDSVPKITVLRSYVAAGNVADFLAALTAGASENAPAGRQPYVTIDHVDTVTTSAAVDAMTLGRAWADARFYGGASDIALAKMLVEELKLIGAIPSIGADGRYVLVPFRIGAGTEASAYVIDASTNLSGAQLPGFEPSAFGLLNTLKLMTGFDPIDGKHHGDTFLVRDAVALSRQPIPSTMKIEPRSEALAGGRSIPTADVVALAQAWLGVLGAAYATASITCPLSAIACTVGTLVSITVSQIPDTESGGRGVVSLPGVVIGRAVKPLEATVELTILTSQVRIAGYTPSSSVTSVTSLGAGLYDVLLVTPQPTGYATAASWAIGDAVALRQYDVATPTEITAIVTAVDAVTRKVTIGSLSAGVPTGALTLEYGAASLATAHQQAYCYIATTADAIGFSTSAQARQFAA